MDMPRKHENISLLDKSMQEEESMVYWYKIQTPLILDNLWPKIINTSVRRGQDYLLNHIGSDSSHYHIRRSRWLNENEHDPTRR